MPFTIMTERQAVNTYTRRNTAREALFLASSRVHDGAEKVMVYDEWGQFVGAAALAAAARDEIGAVNAVQKAVDAAVAELLTLEPQPYTPNSGLTIDMTAGTTSRSATPEAVEAHAEPVKRGRVRVFRAAGKSD
ncbi:hypothetical protein MKK69_01120 [Methylobacterium sp. J-026]|uniref:hypothetical protein n=1 Tax=Methylobacterium sp. J-026 TaxID=2836624 RepID=UPI001FB9E818|nr:hypothetical protein [Methylobacterium sp. J-026]MCJ2132681.1 hypothetical protein [Methylobacterium sp. J-026]